MPTIDIIHADYHNPLHGQAIVTILNAYAQDPMGQEAPLSGYTQTHLIEALQTMPGAFTVLAFVDQQPAGLINCFEGLSSFLAKRLYNIHDVCVSPNFRGLGLSIKMLAAVEAQAKQQGFCKLTLEVLSNNRIAQSAYLKFGFEAYQLNPETGQALFWQKKL